MDTLEPVERKVATGISPSHTVSSIKAPVLGLYGEDDARVNATIEPAAAEMKKLNKTYEVEIYKGAGHGFMRAGDAPPPALPAPKGDPEVDKAAADKYEKDLAAYKANKKARDEAWTRWKAILARI